MQSKMSRSHLRTTAWDVYMIDQDTQNALIANRIEQAKEMITDVELLIQHNS